jgi:hypothetical protein
MIDGIIALETDLLNEVLFNAANVRKAILNYYRKLKKSERI